MGEHRIVEVHHHHHHVHAPHLPVFVARRLNLRGLVAVQAAIAGVWFASLLVIPFLAPALGNSVLFVTEISLWANFAAAVAGFSAALAAFRMADLRS